MRGAAFAVSFASLIFFGFAIGCGSSKHNPDAGPGGDGAAECTAEGETRCEGATFETCQTGAWNVTSQCPLQCDPALGCVACGVGVDYCVGDTVHSCDASGHDGGVVATCSASQACVGGKCVDPCADAAANRSYLGCEYWAVDLDNAVEIITTPDQALGGCASLNAVATTQLFCYDANNQDPDPNNIFGNKVTAGLCDAPGNTCPGNYKCTTTPKSVCAFDAQHSPYAIVVSNPQTTPVDVTVSDGTGHSQTTTVAAGAVKSLFPQQMGFADASLDQTMKAKRAYKVTSTKPIVAYQFNPLDNVGVFSNDASLLIPKATFDVQYIALTYPTLTRRPDNQDYNGYVTIVAPQDGTTISVTPTADVRANTGVAAISKGTTAMFTLDAYEVLNLEAVADGDLTGTVIQSMDTKTFGVFTGTEASGLASDAPGGGFTAGPCCADHLEEMMFPTSTWGKSFAIARSQVRLTSKPERDVLRILAQKAGTTVTFSPNPAKGTCGTLDVGKFCQVEISGDTSITASEPILVGHYLVSAIWQNGLTGASVGSGDPSLAIGVPVEQFRSSYAILVPAQYDNSYVSIVIPAGGAASIDGAAVTGQLTAFAGGSFSAGRIKVSAGAHKIECGNGGCGIDVYGYSDAVSYMFAGGLDLKQIVVN
jgi:hypothetical protein